MGRSLQRCSFVLCHCVIGSPIAVDFLSSQPLRRSLRISIFHKFRNNDEPSLIAACKSIVAANRTIYRIDMEPQTFLSATVCDPCFFCRMFEDSLLGIPNKTPQLLLSETSINWRSRNLNGLGGSCVHQANLESTVTDSNF
ncbi:hypothetical protein L208DRAFT_231247 [Tricholoma matsutake]|nr:hypothetical protein L208DRAFT_231247 [Tricholoma matsutake 945]